MNTLMGNRLYFLIGLTLVIGGYAAGHYFGLNAKYWFGYAGVLAFYAWCKNEFSGSPWRKRKVSSPPPLPERPEPDLPPLTEAAKEGYRELVRRCLPLREQHWLFPYIDALKDHTNDPEYSTLNVLMNHLNDQECEWLLGIDRDAPLEDLEWRLNLALRDNYQLSVAFPQASDFPPGSTLSSDGVLDAFDKPLREHGLQMGFMRTELEEYVIMLHRVADRDKVDKAVQQTGHGYYELT